MHTSEASAALEKGESVKSSDAACRVSTWNLLSFASGIEVEGIPRGVPDIKALNAEMPEALRALRARFCGLTELLRFPPASP